MDTHTLLRRVVPVPASSSVAPPPPQGIQRHFIQTDNGDLEILSAQPLKRTSKPSLLFIHGGFGSALCYRHYLKYFAARGYYSYAVSLRGHGNSWQPGYWRMYWMPREEFLKDILAGIKYVEGEDQTGPPVLFGHSAGGGLVQEVAARGDVQIRGAALIAALPGSGSWRVNWNWLWMDPLMLLRFSWHQFHPRSPLSSTALVKRAFFSSLTDSEVKSVERTMPPWESMTWAWSMFWKFVDPAKVVKGMGKGMLVVAAVEDRLVGTNIPEGTALWYRKYGGNVEFAVVEDVGHHLMLDKHWIGGAHVVRHWLEGLD